MTYKRLMILAAFAAVLGLGMAGWLATQLLRAPGQTSALAIGGPFVLASANGGTVDSRSLAGAPYAVFFGFTHCPEVCPTTLYEMSSSLTALGDAAKDFRVFFITVDPARDTLPVMRDYMANFDPRIEALVPTEAELQQLAADFRVYFAKVPAGDGGYTMDHTATTFLFNRSGRLAGTLAYDEPPATRQEKLKRLLGG